MTAKTAKKKKAFHVTMQRERCKACYLCLDACPKHVFEKGDGFNARGYQPVRVARPQDCIGCRACVMVCPDVCFELFQLEETA